MVPTDSVQKMENMCIPRKSFASNVAVILALDPNIGYLLSSIRSGRG